MPNPAVIRILLLLLFPSTCVLAQKMLPSAAVPGMIDSIHQRIVDLHPFAFETAGVAALEVARTQVQGEVSGLLDARDSLSLLDFKRLTAPLQEVTQCGHLVLEPFYDSLTYVAIAENFYPLALTPVDDGRYLLKKGLRTTTDSLPPGTQLTTLEGRPIGELIEEFSYFAGLNDRGNKAASRAGAASGLASHYQRYYGLRDSLHLTADGRKYVLKPRHRPFSNPKKSPQNIHDWLSFRLTEDGQTGILRIKKFSDYEFYNGSYFRFIRKTFDSLRTAGIDQLIIDIRGNGGGSNRRIKYLFAFLTNKKFQFSSDARLTGPAKAEPGEEDKITRLRARGAATKSERYIQRELTKKTRPRKADQRYTGRVVVLIDHLTFSASGMFARYVQGSGRGKLVGTTAGAAAGTTYGGRLNALPFYVGPEKAFELRVNTISLQLPYPIAGNVTPDVVVPVTETGLRNGVDEQMEAARRIVADK
ncbi:MAG: S41 family peptidase [Bacteroidota bacterium]